MGRHAAIQKRQVWNGVLAKTDSGLTRSMLTESKSGQIVSKEKQKAGIKQMNKLRASGLAAPPFQPGVVQPRRPTARVTVLRAAPVLTRRRRI